MDRRIALFVFGVFVLFACDDSNDYDPCESKGCEKKDRTASWRTDQTVAGLVTVNGTTYRDSEVRATRTGFVVERYESAVAPQDAGAEASNDDAGVDAGDDADAADASPDYQLRSHEVYGSTFRLRVAFAPPSAPGVHRLEDVGAVATIDAAPIELAGTLEVLDVHSEDVSAPGAPVQPPYEMPFGWVMKSTTPEVTVDLRVESRATWSEGYGYRYCQ